MYQTIKGSVSVVSNHKGEPYERVEYLPFGEIWIEDTDPATSYIPFRFTSKELDEETGLYYYGARYYEPTVSRWMSADPAGFALINPMDEDGWFRSGYSAVEVTNWYSYVANNPINHIDPTGHLFIIDDLLFSAIGNLLGTRNDGIWEGTWSNFTNSWESLAGTLIGVVRGPTAASVTLVGFLASYFAVELLGATVEFDDMWTITHVDKRFGAFSLGFNIVIGSGEPKVSIRHEKAHTFQSLILGLLYFPVIAIPSLISSAVNSAKKHWEFFTEKWAEAWKKN